MRTDRCRSWSQFLGPCVAVISVGLGLPAWGEGAPGPDRSQIRLGRKLFVQEWMPGREEGREGDGLGPVYNESSCVACHKQGGVGGAGAASQNVDLITATIAPAEGEERGFRKELRKLRRQHAEVLGRNIPKPRAKGAEPNRAELIRLHEGFRESASVVLHHFGVDQDYAEWRSGLLHPELDFAIKAPPGLFAGRNEQRAIALNVDFRPSPFAEEWGDFELHYSQRNPIALFGAGLIEAIPASAIEQEAARGSKSHPFTAGRISRLEDGRIGRFGWKAQVASLDDFVVTACAVELGLEVPGQHQAPDPRNRAYAAPGMDLGQAECAALTAFVRDLPRPIQHPGASQRERHAISLGQNVFERIGCADCHVPSLGGIQGLYSDLLLHDLGAGTADRASYSRSTKLEEDELAHVNPRDQNFPAGPDAFEGSAPMPRPALASEWRTPPLWGLRDSGPYLHDGRASTVDEAIALHNGQALRSAGKYFGLPAVDRQHIQQFLKSLRAPSFSGSESERGGTEHGDF